MCSLLVIGIVTLSQILSENDQNAYQSIQFVLIGCFGIVLGVHQLQTIVHWTKTFETFADERFVNAFDIGLELWTDIGVDLSHQLNATISHFVRTVDNQLPEVFDTDEVLVVHQSNRATLLLQFIQLSIDRFEETIEATEEKVSVRSRATHSCSLHSQIGQQMRLQLHQMILKEVFGCRGLEIVFIDNLNDTHDGVSVNVRLRSDLHSLRRTNESTAHDPEDRWPVRQDTSRSVSSVQPTDSIVLLST